MDSNHRDDTVRIWFNCFGVLDMGNVVREDGWYWVRIGKASEWEIMAWSSENKEFHCNDHGYWDCDDLYEIDERRIEREQ